MGTWVLSVATGGLGHSEVREQGGQHLALYTMAPCKPAIHTLVICVCHVCGTTVYTCGSGWGYHSTYTPRYSHIPHGVDP